MSGAKITLIGDIAEAFTYGSLIVKHAFTGRKVLPLRTLGHWTVVDAQDEHLVKATTWYALPGPKTVYAKSHDNRLLHRTVLGVDSSTCVDHIDQDGLNNTRGNLRPATKSQNGANRGRNRNNRSGFKGVYQRGRRFVAHIGVNGHHHHIGRYGTAEEAARAYDNAARHHFGVFAWRNFPEETQ